VNPIDALKHKWQEWTGEEETPLDGDTPAWIISVAVHLAVLVTLAVIFQQQKSNQVSLVISALDEPTDVELQDVSQEFSFSPDRQVDMGASSLAGVDAALAVAPNFSEQSNLKNDEVQTESPTVVVPVLDSLTSASTIDENLSVKGAAGVGATGAMGAVDRLTEEIAASLEERRTLVVWLLDQSLSMQPQREAIGKRLDRIYEELRLPEKPDTAPAQSPLLSSVMAFGKNVSFKINEPTADLAEIKQAVASIENDPSGVEMTFTAVGLAVKKYQHFRTQSPRRNVLLIVFSDEVGDDEARMEDALSLCRRHEMPVYVVGVPAPFCRKDIEVRYVDPDPQYDQGDQWPTVRQGPESLFPEGVLLPFAGHRHEDLLHLDSGFGPFALTRLCYETGGIYFAVHPNRNEGGKRMKQIAVMSSKLDHFFDPAVMRSYQPEYVSVREYEQKLRHNKARQALFEASKLASVGPMENPRLEFPKEDEAGLKRLLDEAQLAAAKLGPKLDALYQTLKQGEKDRAKLSEPRWQAGFDLALGRVLANKVRTESYNMMLAKAKGGLKFEKPDSDTFVLVAADEISVGSATEKLAKQAREYLERVRTQHAGTPWGLLAEAELKEPIGWKWSEKSNDLAKKKMAMGGGGGNAAPPKDALKKLEKPKPKREGIKL